MFRPLLYKSFYQWVAVTLAIGFYREVVLGGGLYIGNRRIFVGCTLWVLLISESLRWIYIPYLNSNASLIKQSLVLT